MNRIFKYIFASALLIASLSGVANAQMSEAEKAKAQKSIEVDKWTTPGPVDGSYYLNLETFVTGYTSNVTTYETTTESVPLDIVLLLDVSGSMSNNLSGNTSRISALRTAVKNFIGTIKTDAETNSVDHRISLIKFAGVNYPDGTLTYTYTARTSQSYSYNDVNGKNYYYKHTDGNYYLVTAGGNTNKRIGVTIGGTNYYLQGTSLSTTYETGHNANYKLWTGVLYNATNPVVSNVVEGNGYSSGTTNYTQVVKNFRDVKTQSTELNNAVDALTTGGTTAADYGFELANLVFNGANDGSVKVLILFTDGDPTHGSSFDSTVANDVITLSKAMKESGVLVYTIGTFTNPNTNENNYMNNTSSNYPNASSLTQAGTRVPSDKNYFYNVSSATELNNVFQTISKETSQEAANANAGYTEATTENNVTVKDIVTSNFVIPSDAYGNIDLSKIEVYTAKSTGVTRVNNFDYQNYAYTENGYTWDKPVPSTLTPEATKDTETGKTTVSVPGFNFSENWVGWQDSYDRGLRVDAECSLHEGYKLILKILIEPDPNGVGGEVPTNDPASGLYITKNDNEVLLEEYPKPDKVLVPMDLTIVMNGIKDRGDNNLYKEGETAIFKVTDYEGKYWMVAVTANGSGVGTASIKVPFYNDVTKDTYKVEEMPEWSYRFNSKADPSISGNPANSTSISKQLKSEDHTYYFIATDTDPIKDADGNVILDNDGKDSVVSRDFQKYFYHEDNKNNVFNSTANPTGTSTSSRKN